MSTKRSLVRRTALVAATAAAALVLTACGSGADADRPAGHGSHSATTPAPSASGSASSSAAHNAADTAFAQGMIPHHRQAVEMADLAPSRAASSEVKELAAAIKKAQDPEIKTLTGWLTAWGAPVPAEGAADHSAHGAGGAGMMTAAELEKLKAATGKEFDTAFMELMIKHHEGAVAMARTEKAEGAHADAKAMAEAIITSQSAEIDHMKKLLGKS
ncbi:DUF305 domain-containing protein [Streptomyces antimicrobicus]|uniref:DUF305 domain-containing protein n=1 Tax=Streptomyces antimicrobicus TaxID=2883108 RepID=A0ABS8B174_9ACTN|nr:DUF305 domain-containing protein [Streptomyces antimicrobicus]MCB5178364.1 DUF305 domain-containing protein [Streptomyces antimicrobicus]